MKQNLLLIFTIYAILLLQNLVKSDVVNNNTNIKKNNSQNPIANTTNIAITNFQTKLTNAADLAKLQLQEVKAAAAEKEKLIIGQTANRNNTEKALRRKITSTSNEGNKQSATIATTTTTTTTTTPTPTITEATAKVASRRKIIPTNNENAVKTATSSINTNSSKLQQINDKVLENSTNSKNNKTTKEQTFFYTEYGPIIMPKTTTIKTTIITNEILNKTKIAMNEKSVSNITNNNAQITIATQSNNTINSLNKITKNSTLITPITSITPITKSTNTTITKKIDNTNNNNKITKSTTTNITQKSKPKKPLITYGVEDFPELDRNLTNIIQNGKDKLNKSQLQEPETEAIREPPIVEPSQEYSSHDYIVPIATIMLIIPLAIGTSIVAYRRFRDFWATRHYRRMDFLVDGMYND